MLPHASVYVRLGISPIDGIGVFAIRAIPAGTNIFANDVVDIIWIDRATLDWERLSPAERRLYDDFGIRNGALIGCPVNFHNLTPGWYCNEPRDGEVANVAVGPDQSFIASRDIAEGEELTISYANLTAAAAS